MTIIFLFVVGSIFTALGITIIKIAIENILKHDISIIGASIILPFILVAALLAFGIYALLMSGKQIYLWIRESKTQKNGKESTAQIVDYRSASFSKRSNNRIRYSLTLSYTEGGVNKIFKTDYIFDINEFRYLQELKSVKIKIDGNFVTVCEPFAKDIYILDSTYGIEIAFFKKKSVAILLRLWITFFFIALAFLIVSLVIGKGSLLEAAFIILSVINIPFVVPLIVLLIKWFIKKE